MYVVRDIFHLKFGHFKDVKATLSEGGKSIFHGQDFRILTDFTGDAYRLILEKDYKSLSEYEQSMKELANDEWQKWYGKFKEHVISSHREILKKIDL